mgnify:CR=1 FL=1
MGKHLVIMRYLNSTIFIVLLLWGCDRTFDATAQPKVVHKKVVAQNEQIANDLTNETIRTARTTDATAQQKVVRKKVVVQKEQTAKARTNQTVRIAKSNQAARLEKKTTAVKTDKDQAKAKNQAVSITKTDEQALVAKKVEVIPARDAVTKLAKPKKPAVRPRSDISEIKQPATDDSALSSDKLIAATSNVTPKTRTAAIPVTYDAIGKIDPFEPLFSEKPVSVKKKKNKKRTSLFPCRIWK